ncbi:MAG: hypothetical protein EOO89_21300 [Pedobacter sp.]|nr:MAG: hypothetical protein EOO89_21300 [Pedobacter sp.]
MKKLLFGCAILLAAACNSGTKESNSSTELNAMKVPDTALPADELTLNGLTKDEARIMIDAFKKDPSASHNRITSWFDVNFVRRVDSLLSSDAKYDGVRVYFAKDGQGNNTIVMIATVADGKYKVKNDQGVVEIKDKHKDFFEIKLNTRTPEYRNDDDLNTVDVSGMLYNNDPCKVSNCNEKEYTVFCADAKKWAKRIVAGQEINQSAIWYGRKFMQALASELEAGKSANANGVRVYYAKNDEGKNTFVFMPTKDVDGKKVDYFECYDTNKRDGFDRGEECPIYCCGSEFITCP